MLTVIRLSILLIRNVFFVVLELVNAYKIQETCNGALNYVHHSSKMASTDKDYLAYNFSMPTYKQFFVDVFTSAWSAYNNLTSEEMSVKGLKGTLHKFCFISREDIFIFFALAVFWTIIRCLVVRLVFRVSFAHIYTATVIYCFFEGGGG